MATFRQKGKNTYQLRASLGKGSNNKYIYKYKTYRVTEKLTPKQLEAHLQNEAYKFEQDALSQKHFTNAKYNFEDFVEHWKANWLEKEVSENTIVLKLSFLNNHVIPVLGHLRMDKITTMMLFDLMNHLTRKDNQKGELSVSSKQEVHKVLVNIFDSATSWNIIRNNPMTGVKAPTQKKKAENGLNVFDENEIRHLLETLQNELEHWEVFVTLALAAGMRRSELIGLEWKHVDLDNSLIDIQQIISKSREGIELKGPKYNSKRVIAIPTSVVEILKRYKLNSKKESKKILHMWNEKEHNWVFCNIHGKHFHPDTPTKWWKRFLERKKIRHICLHDLRHTSATLLIAKNVHAKVISERLGHKDISTTMNIYGHTLPSVDRKASEKINDIFSL